MTESCQFEVPGEAVPKGRPRLNRRSMTMYTPTTTKVYEDCVGLVASSTRTRYNDSSVKVEVVLFTAKKRPPDIDNVCKSIFDGMIKGGMLDDDSQIWEVEAIRVRSKNPRVQVRVSEIPIREESEGQIF